jgi:hypothetical protein
MPDGGQSANLLSSITKQFVFIGVEAARKSLSGMTRNRIEGTDHVGGGFAWILSPFRWEISNEA